jgi:hypothetical protein
MRSSFFTTFTTPHLHGRIAIERDKSIDESGRCRKSHVRLAESGVLGYGLPPHERHWAYDTMLSLLLDGGWLASRG